MRKPDTGPPRVLVVVKEQLSPDLLTAFQRWRDAGEFTPDSRLLEFVGGELSLLDLETCKRTDGEELSIVSDIVLPKEKGKPKKMFRIMRNRA